MFKPQMGIILTDGELGIAQPLHVINETSVFHGPRDIY